MQHIDSVLSDSSVTLNHYDRRILLDLAYSLRDRDLMTRILQRCTGPFDSHVYNTLLRYHLQADELLKADKLVRKLQQQQFRPNDTLLDTIRLLYAMSKVDTPQQRKQLFSDREARDPFMNELNTHKQLPANMQLPAQVSCTRPLAGVRAAVRPHRACHVLA